jgi:hypothetical protein
MSPGSQLVNNSTDASGKSKEAPWDNTDTTSPLVMTGIQEYGEIETSWIGRTHDPGRQLDEGSLAHDMHPELTNCPRPYTLNYQKGKCTPKILTPKSVTDPKDHFSYIDMSQIPNSLGNKMCQCENVKDF